MSESKRVIIYHGSMCMDGFTSAWVCRQRFQHTETEFHAANYQESPPDVDGKHVVLVDFSYKSDVLREVIDRAASVLVLDHHKSAIEDLHWLPTVETEEQWAERAFSSEPYAACFASNRSGAGIAWDFYFPTTPRPWIVNYVEDADLWRFRLPFAREVRAAIYSYEQTFETWDLLANSSPAEVIGEGAHIRRAQDKQVRDLVHALRHYVRLDGHVVPCVNLPFTHASDAGHLMCTEEPQYPFAVIYFQGRNSVTYSMRSQGDFDVQAIARKFGGGGHKNAAGFRLDVNSDEHPELVTDPEAA